MLLLPYVCTLYLCLLLPSIRCDNLLCYYSPILEREEEVEASFRLILTECRPAERCFKADGRYGNHSALSARGCMVERDCGQAHSLRLKGTIYAMSYSCCNWHYCNSSPGGVARSCSLVVTLLTVGTIVGLL